MIGDCVTFITRDLTGKQANGGAVAIHVAADHGLQPVGISSGGLSSIGKFPMLIITLVAIHVAADHGLQRNGKLPIISNLRVAIHVAADHGLQQQSVLYKTELPVNFYRVSAPQF